MSLASPTRRASVVATLAAAALPSAALLLPAAVRGQRLPPEHLAAIGG